MITTAPSPLKERIKGIFSNPWFGAVAALTSIVAVPLAIFLYIAGQEKPDLRFYVNPVRSVVVQAGTSSDLTIQYQGQPVTSTVSTATIEFWNAGKKPITAADILEPLQLTTEAGHRILEVKVVKTSRDVIGLRLDTSQLATGKVGLLFRILERADAVIVQLIYEGNPSVPISLRGVVIGQAAPLQVDYGGKLQSIQEQYTQNLSDKVKEPFVLSILVWIATIGMWFIPPRGWKKPLAMQLFFVVMASGLLVWGLYEMYAIRVIGPPLNFY